MYMGIVSCLFPEKQRILPETGQEIRKLTVITGVLGMLRRPPLGRPFKSFMQSLYRLQQKGISPSCRF